MQAYFDPKRADSTHALPDCEVFYVDGSEGWTDDDGQPLERGFYWQACFPGCLPDCPPMGPYETEDEALADAQEPFTDDDGAEGGAE